jgi:hypothetical protein
MPCWRLPGNLCYLLAVDLVFLLQSLAPFNHLAETSFTLILTLSKLSPILLTQAECSWPQAILAPFWPDPLLQPPVKHLL